MQDIADTPDGKEGWGRYIGAASGFEMDVRQLNVDTDQILSMHVIGPQLALDTYFDRATLRWEVCGFLDVGMVTAHVFGPVLPFRTMTMQTSALREHGYYYAYGATLQSRLRLETRHFDAELGVRAQQYHSVDGLDRNEVEGPGSVNNVEDRRGYGHLQIGVPLGRSGWGVTFSGDLVFRNGNWATEDRTTFEERVGATIDISP
jgi:hypothetical protein